MPKGVPNKRYTPEFKKLVIETMQEEKLSYSETCRRFEVNSRDRIKSWERIYLEEGPEGFAVERRGRGSTGRPKKQPQDQGKAKGLAACNSQTASPFSCLNNIYFKILSNFGGSLQIRGRLVLVVLVYSSFEGEDAGAECAGLKLLVGLAVDLHAAVDRVDAREQLALGALGTHGCAELRLAVV